MALCEFSHKVKYRGVFYAPYKPFEIDEKDVKELIALGAKMVPQNPQDAKTVSTPQEKKPAKKTPYKIPPPNKKEQ
jgi:hypothetical protein